MKHGLLAISFLGVLCVLAGCWSEKVHTEIIPAPENVGERELERVSSAIRAREANPLAVENRYQEIFSKAMSGSLDFSRGEFFSGMTDEALMRQAMLTWDLSGFFDRMKGPCKVVVMSGDNLMRQALTALLNANSDKVTVISREDANAVSELVHFKVADPAGPMWATCDYILRCRPVSQEIFRSWKTERHGLPYLQRYASAAGYLELLEVGSGRIVHAAAVTSFGNFVGSSEPLVWFPATRGESANPVPLPPHLTSAVTESHLAGYAFERSNELLVDRAYRNVRVKGSGLGTLSGRPGAVAVYVSNDDETGRAADSINGMLADRGVNVCTRVASSIEALVPEDGKMYGPLSPAVSLEEAREHAVLPGRIEVTVAALEYERERLNGAEGADKEDVRIAIAKLNDKLNTQKLAFKKYELLRKERMLKLREDRQLQHADYVLNCRIDYAGVSALPDGAGKETFRRQAAVVFWAELVETSTLRVVWAGQLSGVSDVVTSPLFSYQLLFR